MSGRVVLITGASSGLGQACALHLTRQGFRVYGTSRQVNPARRGPAPLFALVPMDVDDEASVVQGVELVLSKEGRLDAVINSAGFRLAGAAEETTVAEAKAQFETCFFGVLRVCRAVVPTMRRQRAGYIVNIGALAGRIGQPFQPVYSAAKFALEGLTEALRMEVRPFGIRVSVVEPGPLSTGLAVQRCQAAAAPDSAYAERFARAMATLERAEARGASPDRVARLVEKILKTPDPRLCYTAGPAYARLALALKKVLPAALFEWGIRQYYGV